MSRYVLYADDINVLPLSLQKSILFIISSSLKYSIASCGVIFASYDIIRSPAKTIMCRRLLFCVCIGYTCLYKAKKYKYCVLYSFYSIDEKLHRERSVEPGSLVRGSGVILTNPEKKPLERK